MKKNEIMRTIPSIEQMVIKVAAMPEFAALSHAVLVKVLRNATQFVRAEVGNGGSEKVTIDGEGLRNLILSYAIMERDRLLKPNLRQIINATGIVLHTNLGRAPLSEQAKRNVAVVMEGYCSLEYSLEEGKRGDRQQHVSRRLAELTGAEDALVVNNNAAAIMLVLAGLARGKEVIVSRGELVEIGGSFRIPEVLEQSGAILVEVGTTNKTHLSDYARAITPNTAAILKVHTSNYRIVGFVSEPETAELCMLAHNQGVLAINDLGSGTLNPLNRNGYREPSVVECVNAGFDLVTFSGDKLLGGGQAGIIAGRGALVSKLKKEPLTRAFRIDKLSLAALEGTLIDYASGKETLTVPVLSMLEMSHEELKSRAEKLSEMMRPLEEYGWRLKVVETKSLAGGGALPGVELDGFGVEVIPKGLSASQAEARLREGSIPVICMVRDAALVFDVRCLLAGEDLRLCKELNSLMREKKA